MATADCLWGVTTTVAAVAAATAAVGLFFGFHHELTSIFGGHIGQALEPAPALGPTKSRKCDAAFSTCAMSGSRGISPAVAT